MFQLAQKKKSKLRLAVTGPSGSGKTYSALLLAFGLVGKEGNVCVIDTEHDSASLYSDKFPDYYTVSMTPPYSPMRYIQMIEAAESFGADILIIDSLSHEWTGQGGCLEMVEKSNAKNSYTAWGQVTPLHQRLIDKMLSSKTHIIATMRSKQDYALVENKHGKLEPKKMGLAPIQRDGMDYEFTTVFDLPGGGVFEATSSKDRTGLFIGTQFPMNEQIAPSLKEWLEKGVESLSIKALPLGKEEKALEQLKKAVDRLAETATPKEAKTIYHTARSYLVNYPELVNSIHQAFEVKIGDMENA